MILPSKVVRGLDERGPNAVFVYSPTVLSLAARGYGTGAGYKTDAIFAAGIIAWSLFYTFAGAGTTVVRALAMDGDDAAEMPGFVVLGTGLAPGSGVIAVGATPYVATSFKLQFIASTGTNTVTATLFGRAL